jgi:hypothetical protein
VLQLKIKFKLQVNSPVAFLGLTADGTISIIDAVNGRITMNSKIIDVAPATYIFDCQITLLMVGYKHILLVQ